MEYLNYRKYFHELIKPSFMPVFTFTIFALFPRYTAYKRHFPCRALVQKLFRQTSNGIGRKTRSSELHSGLVWFKGSFISIRYQSSGWFFFEFLISNSYLHAKTSIVVIRTFGWYRKRRYNGNIFSSPFDLSDHRGQIWYPWNFERLLKGIL